MNCELYFNLEGSELHVTLVALFPQMTDLVDPAEIPQVEDIVELGRGRPHLHLGSLPEFASGSDQAVHYLTHILWETTLL